MIERNNIRTLRFAKISVVTNVVMAIVKICLGIFTPSLFMCINALYNLGMGFAKHYSLMGIDKAKSRKQEYNYYRIIGIIIFISSLIYMVYSIRMFIGHKSSYQYPEGIAVAIAAFTFIEIILNTISTKKSKVPLLQAIKLTSLASSIISLGLHRQP